MHWSYVFLALTHRLVHQPISSIYPTGMLTETESGSRNCKLKMHRQRFLSCLELKWLPCFCVTNWGTEVSKSSLPLNLLPLTHCINAINSQSGLIKLRAVNDMAGSFLCLCIAEITNNNEEDLKLICLLSFCNARFIWSSCKFCIPVMQPFVIFLDILLEILASHSLTLTCISIIVAVTDLLVRFSQINTTHILHCKRILKFQN